MELYDRACWIVALPLRAAPRYFGGLVVVVVELVGTLFSWRVSNSPPQSLVQNTCTANRWQATFCVSSPFFGLTSVVFDCSMTHVCKFV